jgi:thiol-disulfide isomerase/thioredoxin
MRNKSVFSIIASFALLAVLFSATATVLGAEPPVKGGTLPSFQLPSPSIESDLSYLGLKNATFQLKDISYEVLLIEIIGVYCPRCYEQAPLFNRLLTRLQKKGLGDKVKLLAIAAGGTVQEIEHLRTNGSYQYPIAKDESYEVHKLLGEPRTPYTMLIDREGRVLFAHIGVIEDIDPLLQQMEALVK